MTLKRGNSRAEDFEHISNRDLIDSAHMLMGSIDLDPASSEFANKYVQATEYYNPVDDGLNDQQWYGNVYLFPPNRSYFWDKKSDRWKVTRGLSPTLASGHAVWWRALKRKWLANEINQAIFFTNYMDMAMYCQDIFDHPVCIMKSRPTLMRRYYADDRIYHQTTGTSMIVYLQPQFDITSATESFLDIYSEKGRILV
tara:strand:- start:264 stop:857 length:594 start_codon:yes stop_codon:yes gene_type:complete